MRPSRRVSEIQKASEHAIRCRRRREGRRVGSVNRVLRAARQNRLDHDEGMGGPPG